MKLYSSIILLLSNFFGLGADASESEVHQVLSEAGTLSDIKQKAKEEAQSEFQASINDLMAKVDANNESLSAVKAEIDQLKSDLQSAKDALKAKDDELQASKARQTELATELADLKVENAGKKAAESVDPGIETETQKQAKGNTKEITNEAFMAMFK